MKNYGDIDKQDEDQHIDRLVGNAIEKQASKIDVANLAKRIQASLDAVPTSSKSPLVSHAHSTTLETRSDARVNARNRIWNRSILAVAASTIVLIAFAIGRFQTSAHASAASLVRAARSVHSLTVERCYVVTAENTLSTNDRSFSPFMKDVRIWTSGNRFWVEARRNERRWIWGRNANGAVWMTLGNKHALQIEADEMGQPLQEICDLYSLELESLLTSFQDRWSLIHASSDETTHKIIARPNRIRSRNSEAILEVDKETKAIRRLTLRKNTGDPTEPSVVFTLVGFRTQDESKYEPSGHLAENHQVLTREHFADKRIESLRTWFGPSADRWIRVKNDGTNRSSKP